MCTQNLTDCKNSSQTMTLYYQIEELKLWQTIWKCTRFSKLQIYKFCK